MEGSCDSGCELSGSINLGRFMSSGTTEGSSRGAQLHAVNILGTK
jgi:hypothetical protein